MKQLFGVASFRLSSNTDDQFFPLFAGSAFSGNATFDDAVGIMATGGTIKEIFIKASVSPGSGNSFTATLYKNGVATSLTTSIFAAQTSSINLTDEVSISAGDKVAILLRPFSNPSTARVAVGCSFETTSDTKSLFNSHGTSLSIPTSTFYERPGSVSVLDSSPLGNGEVTIPHDITITDVYFSSTTAPGTGENFTVQLKKNGVALASTLITVSDTDIDGSATSISESFSQGDTLEITQTRSSGAVSSNSHFVSIAVDSDKSNRSIMTLASGFNISTSANDEYYYPYRSTTNIGGPGIVGIESVQSLVSSATVENLYVESNNAPGGTGEKDFTIEIDNVSSALEATLTSTDTTASDTTSVVQLGLGESISLKHTNVSTSSNSMFPNFSVTFQTNPDDSRSAELTGAEDSQSNRSAEITGEGFLTEDRLAELTGQQNSNDSRQAEVSGVDTAEEDRSSEITGFDTAEDFVSAEVGAEDTAQAERSAELSAEQGVEDDALAEISGEATTGSNRPAETTGEDNAFSDRSAEIVGETAGTDVRAAELSAEDVSLEDRAAEVGGQQLSQSDALSEISGVDTTDDDRSSEISGQQNASGDAQAEVRGELTADNDALAEVTGEEIVNSDAFANIFGEDGAQDFVDAEVTGESSLTDTRDAEVGGQVISVDNIPAEISGTGDVDSSVFAETTGESTGQSSALAEITGGIGSDANAEITGEAGIEQIFSVNSNDSPSTTDVEYVNFMNSGILSSWNSLNEPVKQVLATPGIIDNLYIDLDSSPGDGTYVFEVMKNGSPTGLSLTLSNSDISASDSVTVINYVAGDTISLRSTPSGTPGSVTPRWSFRFCSDFQRQNIVTSSTQTASGTRYFPIFGNGGSSSIESFNESSSPHGFAVEAFYIRLQNAPGVGNSFTFVVRKNGADQAATSVTISGTDTTGSVTGVSVPYIQGDLITVKSTSTGTPVLGPTSFSLQLLSDVDGDSIVGGTSGVNSASTSSARYNTWNSSGLTWNANETLRESVGNLKQFALKNLHILTNNAPGVGSSYDFNARLNNSDSLLEATVADGNTSASNLSDVLFVRLGDVFSISSVPTNSPTGTQSVWSATQNVIAANELDSSVSAEISGVDTSDDSRPAQITGFDTAETSANAEITGQDERANVRAAELTGELTSEDDRSSELFGEDLSVGVRAAEIDGEIEGTDVRLAEITGEQLIASSALAEVSGEDLATADRNAEITGELTDQDDVSAEVRGSELSVNSKNAEITGSTGSQDDVFAEIRGIQTLGNNIEAEVTGSLLIGSDRQAEIDGLGFSVNSRLAELIGAIDGIDARLAEINGIDTTQNEVAAEVGSSDSQSGEVNAEISGVDTAEVGRSAEIIGQNDNESLANAEISGIDRSSNRIDAEILGEGAEQDNRPAEVGGAIDSQSSRPAELPSQGFGFDNQISEIAGQEGSFDFVAAEINGTDVFGSSVSAEISGFGDGVDSSSEVGAQICGAGWYCLDQENWYLKC